MYCAWNSCTEEQINFTLTVDNGSVPPSTFEKHSYIFTKLANSRLLARHVVRDFAGTMKKVEQFDISPENFRLVLERVHWIANHPVTNPVHTNCVGSSNYHMSLKYFHQQPHVLQSSCGDNTDVEGLKDLVVDILNL
jgi:hypothetical protein